MLCDCSQSVVCSNASPTVPLESSTALLTIACVSRTALRCLLKLLKLSICCTNLHCTPLTCTEDDSNFQSLWVQIKGLKVESTNSNAAISTCRHYSILPCRVEHVSYRACSGNLQGCFTAEAWHALDTGNMLQKQYACHAVGTIPHLQLQCAHQLISLKGSLHTAQKQEQVSENNRQILEHPVSATFTELLHILFQSILDVGQYILKVLNVNSQSLTNSVMHSSSS